MKETFLKNGGYIVKKETIFPYAEDVRYMDCSCGRQVRNVGEDCESVARHLHLKNTQIFS